MDPEQPAHSHPAGLWGLGTSGPRWRQRLLLWPGRSQDHWALRTRRASQDQPGPGDGREPHLSRPPPGSGTVPTEHSQSPPLAPTPTLLQPRHPAQHPGQAPHVHSKCSLLLYPSAHVSTHIHTHTHTLHTHVYTHSPHSVHVHTLTHAPSCHIHTYKHACSRHTHACTNTLTHTLVSCPEDQMRAPGLPHPFSPHPGGPGGHPRLQSVFQRPRPALCPFPSDS